MFIDAYANAIFSVGGQIYSSPRHIHSINTFAQASSQLSSQTHCLSSQKEHTTKTVHSFILDDVEGTLNVLSYELLDPNLSIEGYLDSNILEKEDYRDPHDIVDEILAEIDANYVNPRSSSPEIVQ
ncbi:hypothetical protein Bhyg_05975 [Pseudolycoriella hygida]|uniref:Uncharacterized protein n=1 Tax=Pseudolycoriella hygida TaxID=35572 RepID=A0A9Q0N115_9DIPT|nr:hypothetical protein Bhyg_05975 [Pseudolycoriella hygida]